MKDVIVAALAKLDPAVDSHWNADGQVNLNTFKFLAGGVAVSREQLEEVAPNFCRENPQVDSSQKDASVSGQQEGGENEMSEGASVARDDVQVASLDFTLSEQSFTPVAQLSDEELSKISENYLEIVGDLSVARDKFNKHIDQKIAYLHAAKAEQDKRQPQMSLADMVRLAHENSMKNNVPANTARPRPHTAYPLLKK